MIMKCTQVMNNAPALQLSDRKRKRMFRKVIVPMLQGKSIV